MLSNICGIVLRVSDKIPALAEKHILGRSCLDWVATSLGDGFCCAVDTVEGDNIIQLLQPHLEMQREYTVVLFCDTPLVTRKTILDAVHTLEQQGLNVLKMTRGYVFRTEYLSQVDALYAPRPYYFEEEDFLTISSHSQLALVTEYLRMRILNYHMQNGVHIVDTASTYIDCGVCIGRNVVIEPGNHLCGTTIVHDGVHLQRDNTITDSVIGPGAVIRRSELESSSVGAGSRIGPFAFVRPHSIIAEECVIGDFVELKNSIIGARTKIRHHAYVGDAEVGTECNIGCGVIFANYDGVTKHRTRLGDRVFVGSNSCLVAPLTLASDIFVAAGSTVTSSAERGLVIARAQQVNRPEWQRRTTSTQD